MMCQNCHKRKTTVTYVGEGGMLDFIHGMYERLCKHCCLEKQIKYAEKHKNDLKRFKKELKDL